MIDYEELILARQESEADDCSGCKYLQDCRNGTKIGGCVCDYDEETYRKEVEYLLRDF